MRTPTTAILPRMSCSVKFFDPTVMPVPSTPSIGWMAPGEASVAAVLVALLALAVDWLGRVVEHVARPKGL